MLTAKSLKEAWLDKGLSFVLLDVRPEAQAGQGFIPGAANVPEQELDQAVATFPKQELKPPVVIYDAKGDGSAERVARKLIKAGYPGPRVLTGGFAAWQGAGFQTATGKPPAVVSYVPKPKPGTIAVSEFQSFARGIPAGVQLLDVRGADEAAKTGMIKGAVNIPADEIADRLGEVSKEKKVVLHCSTGTRAEMGYTILKEKGYQVQYLDATITPNQDGGFTIK
nr:rhodanese-like domain-containing protein [Geomonas oryzisoli]